MDEKRISDFSRIIKEKVEDPFETLLKISKEFSIDNDNYGVVLQVLLEQFSANNFKTEPESKMISQEELMLVDWKYFNLLEAMIYRLVDENMDEALFYEKLYECVFQSPLFAVKNDEERAILLFFMIARINVLPYFHIENTSPIDKQEFTEILNRLSPEIQKVVHILNRRIVSRTEEAAALYQLLNQVEDEEEKVVLLSTMLRIKEALNK